MGRTETDDPRRRAAALRSIATSATGWLQCAIHQSVGPTKQVALTGQTGRTRIRSGGGSIAGMSLVHGDPMNRRSACRSLAAFPFALTVPAAAQPVGPLHVAWVTTERKNAPSANFDAFRRGLREFGYTEGGNLVIDVWSGDGSAERVEMLVGDVIRSKPEIIVAAGGLALFALLRVPVGLPIVFSISADPVEAKIVKSFARPGGSLTGISLFTLALVGKRLELLKEIVPAIKRVSLIANPQHPGEQKELAAAREAASKLGIAVRYFPVSSERSSSPRSWTLPAPATMRSSRLPTASR